MTVRPGASNPVTELLLLGSEGDNSARDKFIPIVYEELRRIARRILSLQRHNQTLQSTALVHGASLRLVGQTSVQSYSRVHFFAVSAQLLRRILVDHVRKRNARKRGGDAITLVLDDELTVQSPREIGLLAVDNALVELAKLDERRSRMVELRFFGDLTIEEIASTLEISPAIVKREWATAKLWLLREMSRSAQAS